MSSSNTIEELLLRWQEQRRHDARPSVEDLCAEHPSLIDELNQRVAAFESMEALLHIAQPRTLPDAKSQPEVPAHLVEKLRPLGYELQSLIDQGGMGVVYRATQLELGRVVALKMIAGLRASPKQLVRFQIEVEAVAKLHHPHIVQIYECGAVDGHWFFSMEYVEGGTLAHLVEEEPLVPAVAAELVETLARAMHHAHIRGVVHRDLKPANILLSHTGESGYTPKVSDFGLAKHLDSDHDHTATGEVLGTPSYMAPEQAEGKSEAIGPACDVYALGAILYQALTGRPPFQGKSVLETLRRVVCDDPVSPSRIVSRVPRDLEAICLKCLEKKPERRYPTAEMLAEDLERFRTGRPVVARPLTVFGRSVKWSRRRPVLAALLALLALAPVAIAGRDYWQREQERRRVVARAVEVAPQAREILTRHCVDCHGPKLVKRNFRIDERASLLDVKRRYVVPGHPETSRMMHRIIDGTMPPREDELHRPRVAAIELSILQDWIAGGAPDFPPENPEHPTPPVVPYSPLARQVKEIFVAHCYECHRYPEKDAKGGVLILDHELLSNTRPLIIPGQPEQSELYQLLLSDDETIRMPFERDPLSPAEIATIRKWIAEGAPPFPRTFPNEKEK